MKKLYILPIFAIVLASCSNYFDEHQMDNGNPHPEDIRTGMTYTFSEDDYQAVVKNATNIAKALAADEDSTAYKAFLTIASNKAFNDVASADLYVGALMAEKFPYLDNGTMCDVTYRMLEGKSARIDKFNQASSLTLALADYEAIWNGHGAEYLTASTEAAIPAYLSQKFPTANEGKIMVVTYDFADNEPESILPFLPYECSVHDILEAKEITEHQFHGTVGFFKPAVAKATGQFYLKDENGVDSILVYSMKDENGGKIWEKAGIAYGDNITIKAFFSNASGEPQLTNAVFVSKSSPSAPVRKAPAAQKLQTKSILYQLTGGNWVEYADDQLKIALALPHEVYQALDATTIANPALTIGTWLRITYPYAAADEVYLVAYNTATGYKADEWVFDGSDFVMTTGYVDESMSFEVKNHQWIANISTYLQAAFVGEGLGKFSIQHVNLDGLSYVWRYQAAYGATASAYVSSVNHRVEDWLISPNIRMKKSVQPQMTYMNAVRYGNTTDNPTWLSVMVTNNFTGDVTTTEWEKLPFPAELPDGSNWTFISSGVYDLSKYNGQTIVIAFRYKTDFDGIEVPSAPTWEIQNLLVAEPSEETDESVD